MATVKTVVLTAGTETVIACDGGRHTNVENKTTGTVYVSRFSGVVADADEVYAIAPGQRKLIFDCEGTAYALATVSGSVEIMGTNFANANFKSAGGEGVNSSATAGDLSLSATLNYKDKWLDCHGQNVSRTDFPELFAQIGTAYGAGNGVDTFTLPDTEDLTTSDTVRYNIYTGVSNAPLQFKCKAGAFSATVGGFTNPVWRYKDAEITGNAGVFTIENDGDVVRLEGEATGSAQLGINSSSAAYFAADLKDLQGRFVYYLGFDGCTNITGDLSDLQGKVWYSLHLRNCSNITGDLSDLQGNLTYYLSLRDCINITGDLADLQGKIRHYLDLLRCPNISGVYTPAENSPIHQIYLTGTGQTSADVDATIIAVAANIAETNTNGTLYINARTSASDDAIVSLKAKDWTIVCGGVAQ